MLVGMLASAGVISLVGGVIATSVFVFSESESSNGEHNRVSQETTKIDRWFSRDVRQHVANDLLDSVPATSATFVISSGGGSTIECSFNLVVDEIVRECGGTSQVIGRHVTELEFLRSGDTVTVSFGVASPVRTDIVMEHSVTLRSDISNELASRLGLQTTLAAGPSCPLPAIDFETDGSGYPLGYGTVIDEEWASAGIHVSVENAGGRVAMLFDSSSPTGSDFDLGAPNKDFGGPGKGLGGRMGEPGANAEIIGNVLIISEDGDSSDPDDNAGGGTFVFTFDSPASISSIGFLDVEENYGTVQTLDGLGVTIDVRTIPDPGDNGVDTLFLNDHGVSELRITFPNSGSVTEINFSCG